MHGESLNSLSKCANIDWEFGMVFHVVFVCRGHLQLHGGVLFPRRSEICFSIDADDMPINKQRCLEFFL